MTLGLVFLLRRKDPPIVNAVGVRLQVTRLSHCLGGHRQLQISTSRRDRGQDLAAQNWRQPITVNNKAGLSKCYTTCNHPLGGTHRHHQGSHIPCWATHRHTDTCTHEVEQSHLKHTLQLLLLQLDLYCVCASAVNRSESYTPCRSRIRSCSVESDSYITASAHC